MHRPPGCLLARRGSTVFESLFIVIGYRNYDHEGSAYSCQFHINSLTFKSMLLSGIYHWSLIFHQVCYRASDKVWNMVRADIWNPRSWQITIHWHCLVFNLQGYCWAREVPFTGSHVLQRSISGHCCVWYYACILFSKSQEMDCRAAPKCQQPQSDNCSSWK